MKRFKPRRFSITREALSDLRQSGEGVRKIGRRFGAHPTTVRNWLIRFGLDTGESVSVEQKRVVRCETASPRICTRCQVSEAKGRTYCAPCHAAMTREWRKGHALTPEQRMKDRARSYANTYLKRGKIQRQSCEVCGAKAEMHHDDYSKPLQVRWLCRDHHLEHHAEHDPMPPQGPSP